MSHEYTIVLSDVEKKALEYAAVDVNQWIQNAVHERCRMAGEELIADTIKHNLANGIPISGTPDEIIMNSTLPNAQARHEEAMSKMVLTVNGNLPE